MLFKSRFADEVWGASGERLHWLPKIKRCPHLNPEQGCGQLCRQLGHLSLHQNGLCSLWVRCWAVPSPCRGHSPSGASQALEKEPSALRGVCHYRAAKRGAGTRCWVRGPWGMQCSQSSSRAAPSSSGISGASRTQAPGLLLAWAVQTCWWGCGGLGQFLVISISRGGLMWTPDIASLHPVRAAESSGAARPLWMTLCCTASPHSL